MQESKSISECLKEASVEAGITASPVTRGRTLAAKLAKPAKPAVATITTTVPVAETKVRDVIEFGKHAKIEVKPATEQKEWEHRAYMREWFVEKPNADTVTHNTSHTTKEIYDHAIEAMQKMYSKRTPANPMFKAHDLVVEFSIYGPAVSDIVRNAMKKLQKDGKVKIHTTFVGKNPRYSFELLDLPKIQ